MVQGLGAFVEERESRKPDAALRAEAMESVRKGLRELHYSGMFENEMRAFVSEVFKEVFPK